MTIMAKDEYCPKCGKFHPEGSEDCEWHFKNYVNKRVYIPKEDKYGEPFESIFNVISVFVDGEDKCRYFNMSDVKLVDNEG